VNAIMTATYWEIGRRIVELEQGGSQRADYGAELLVRLAVDLTARFGRGFGEDNLRLFRSLYLTYPSPAVSQAPAVISESLIRKFAPQDAASSESKSPIWISRLKALADAFPLSWTHYVRLLRLRNPLARQFYETEALRGGWSVRQLERQIGTQFYERTALSRNKVAMLRKTDLKTGPLSHADIGQMHLYLNYARVHWVPPHENPPVGLILCTEHGESLARYAMEGLPNKMLIREYRTALPSEELLAEEIARARRMLETRRLGGR